GLNNRRYLDEALTNLNNDLSYPLTIMVVDVNGLKLTNDAFGHTAGDALLKAVAKICREVTRNGDIVCRTGGDEFVLILHNSDRAQAKALKDRIVSLASKTNIDSLSV
ncbi:MAG TPA: histidine kinase, partial [Clostridiaceae bacterium]|nr:histidine kinase [Clostridiaceae bacterium]